MREADIFETLLDTSKRESSAGKQNLIYFKYLLV
jgi:hypothetical protein